MEKTLMGKNVIVTGGRKGIGRQIVECMVRQGANVFACSHKQDGEFEQDMQDLSDKYGVRIKPIYFDLLNPQEIQSAMKEIIQEKIPLIFW